VRWLLGILVLLPQPLVMFMFVAGGADGKKSSAITWALATAPVFLCAIFAVYRLIRAEKLLLLDWIVIAVALAPYWVAAWVIAKVAMGKT
jgi:hypothetical protein